MPASNPRGFAILGFPNLVSRPACTVTVPDTGTIPDSGEMGPEWLKTAEPSDRSRILSNDPFRTRWLFTFTGGSFRPLDGLAAINSNISKQGFYRFMAGSPDYEVLQPASLVSSTNTTGSVSDLSESIQYPDGLYMGPAVTTGGWESTIEFDGPTTNPISGFARAMIVVRVALAGETTNIYPMCTVELYQGSTFLLNLGWRACATSGNGQIFIFTFNPNILIDPTGAGIRAKLTFDPGDNTAYAVMDSIKLYIDHSTTAMDSGWVASPISNSDIDEIHPTVSFHYFPLSSWLGLDSFSVCILDDQVDHDPYLGSGFSPQLAIKNVSKAIPDGFVDLGVVSAGPAIFLSIGETKDNPITVEILIEGISGKTIGGQNYGADLFRRRGIPSVQFTMTKTESDSFMERVAWVRGLSSPIYISANPDTETPSNLSSFWAVLLSASSTSMPASLNGEQYHIIQTAFEEKL